MKIRRFFAKDMRSALSEVTSELGADAAILSSTKVSGGVEVVAATDYDDAMLHAQAKSQSKSTSSLASKQSAGKDLHETNNELLREPSASKTVIAKNSSAKSPSKSHSSGEKNSSVSSLETLFKQTLKHIRHQTETDQNQPSEATQDHHELSDINPQSSSNFEQQKPPTESPAYPKVEWSQEPTLVAMREELNLLRNLLQEQVSEMVWQKKCALTPMTVALQKNLKLTGIHQAIVDQLVSDCEPEKDYECAWQKALALLAKRISIAEDEILTYGGVVALVGPTGVGKTTTLAKLAAKHVLQHGPNSVALITTDSYRVAAHEQIKTYGRILQVPVKVAADAKQLKQALRAYSNRRLVLIDTAGMSRRDERLSQQMSCLAREDIHVKNHLVLSAISQAKVLTDAIELFEPFKLQSCIITKIDEAASLGEIISTIIARRLRVSYMTDGQRVPEDIKAVRAHQLVAKMVWLTRNNNEIKHSDEAIGTK